MGVTGGDDVGGQGFGREPSIFHCFPKAVQDHSSVLGRWHGGYRDQPSRRKSQWNSAMMEGEELTPTGEQHQSGTLDALALLGGAILSLDTI